MDPQDALRRRRRSTTEDKCVFGQIEKVNLRLDKENEAVLRVKVRPEEVRTLVRTGASCVGELSKDNLDH